MGFIADEDQVRSHLMIRWNQKARSHLMIRWNQKARSHIKQRAHVI
ncbi:MAG: hypothetical protein ACOCXU_05560 [Coleofasciculus sp.]